MCLPLLGQASIQCRGRNCKHVKRFNDATAHPFSTEIVDLMCVEDALLTSFKVQTTLY